MVMKQQSESKGDPMRIPDVNLEPGFDDTYSHEEVRELILLKCDEIDMLFDEDTGLDVQGLQDLVDDWRAEWE
jgi:hypothetical protein